MKSSKLLLTFGLATVLMLGSIQTASALSTPSFSWKVTTLTPSSKISPSKVWSTSSKGVVKWNVSGSGCSRSGVRIATKKSGKCKVTVTVAATAKGTYSKITKSRIFTISKKNTTPPITTTTGNTPPITTTTGNTPPITTTTGNTSVVLSCAMGGECIVGDTGPGGGTVFYVASSFSSDASCGSRCRYLEVAPTGWGQSASSICTSAGNSSTDPICVWSANQNLLVDTATGIGAGFANTASLLRLDSTSQAARAANLYDGGSKSDWYVPSRNELNELCKYAWRTATGDTSIICSDSDMFFRVGFTKANYWSSSSNGTGNTYHHDLNVGFRSYSDSRGALYVRVIRAF